MVQKSGDSPVDTVHILFFLTGFYTSQVVQDFFHQQYCMVVDYLVYEEMIHLFYEEFLG